MLGFGIDIIHILYLWEFKLLSKKRKKTLFILCHQMWVHLKPKVCENWLYSPTSCWLETYFQTQRIKYLGVFDDNIHQNAHTHTHKQIHDGIHLFCVGSNTVLT